MKAVPITRRAPMSRGAGFKPAEPKPAAGPKQKACRVCRTKFVGGPLQIVCGVECAIQHGKAVTAKQKAKAKAAERAEDRVKRDKLKTRGDWAALAQRAVNRYINLRDRHKPCVSCGKPAAAGGVRNASHFKSVGSNSALRFHLWNIHTSCYRCNVELSGNLGEYLPRLIERIGVEKVEFLQTARRDRRYDIEYLQRIKKIFAKKARRLERKVKC